MKKNFIIAILFAFVMVFTGCSKNRTEYPVPVDDSCSRFQIVYVQHANFAGNFGLISIILDKETGNKYLFFKNGYGGGLTKLEE